MLIFRMNYTEYQQIFYKPRNGIPYLWYKINFLYMFLIFRELSPYFSSFFTLRPLRMREKPRIFVTDEKKMKNTGFF